MMKFRRKRGETLVIDGRITIQVERITPSIVDLTVDLPPENRVWRGEIWARMRTEPRFGLKAWAETVGGVQVPGEWPPPIVCWPGAGAGD